MPINSKGYFLLFLIIISLIGMLSSALLLFTEWNQLTLPEAIRDGQVAAEIGGLAENASFTEPMLQVTINKHTFLPLSIVIPQGSILESASDEADVVTLQGQTRILFAPSSVKIFAYSLDYNKSFPSSRSEYKPQGTANEELTQVLNNIVARSAQDEVPSQLAVWSAYQKVGAEEIEKRVGVTGYAARANEIGQANEPPRPLSTNSWLLWVAFILSTALTFVFGTLFWRRDSEKKVIDQLSDWHLLADGGMAEVWVARRHEPVIVKFPQTHRHELYQRIVTYRFETEIEQHQKLDHPNIVSLIEYGETIHPISKKATYYLIQEFIHGSTLDKLLSQAESNRLPEPIIFEITAQILTALAYIHEQEVIHRDLTLKNVMVEKTGQVYLIDFGNSTPIGSQDTELRGLLNVGTAPFYAPPEMENTPERDFYGLAMLIYAMYGGELIKGEEAHAIKRAIEKKLDELKHVPPWLRRVLKGCWNGEYKECSELRQALRLSPLNEIFTEIKGEKLKQIG